MIKLANNFTLEHRPVSIEISSLDAYVDSLAKSGRKPSYIHDCRRYILQLFQECGIDRIEELSLEIVEEWAEMKLDQGFATRSVKKMIDPIRTFTKWCVSKGVLSVDPLAGLTIDVDPGESSDRHQTRFQRLFRVMESLSSLRFGATLDMIHELQLDAGRISARTTYRDIQLLQNLGLVYRERNESMEVIVYKLNTTNRLIQKFASTRPEPTKVSRMESFLPG